MKIASLLCIVSAVVVAADTEGTATNVEQLQAELTKQKELLATNQAEWTATNKKLTKEIQAKEKELKDMTTISKEASAEYEKEIASVQDQLAKTAQLREERDSAVSEAKMIQQKLENCQGEVKECKATVAGVNDAAQTCESRMRKLEKTVEESSESQVRHWKEKTEALAAENAKLKEKGGKKCCDHAHFSPLEWVSETFDAASVSTLAMYETTYPRIRDAAIDIHGKLHEQARPYTTIASAKFEEASKVVGDAYDKHARKTVDPVLKQLDEVTRVHRKKYVPLLEKKMAKAQKELLQQGRWLWGKFAVARANCIRSLSNQAVVGPYARTVTDLGLGIISSPFIYIAIQLVIFMLSLILSIIYNIIGLFCCCFCCGLCRSARKEKSKPTKNGRKSRKGPVSRRKKND